VASIIEWATRVKDVIKEISVTDSPLPFIKLKNDTLALPPVSTDTNTQFMLRDSIDARSHGASILRIILDAMPAGKTIDTATSADFTAALDTIRADNEDEMSPKIIGDMLNVENELRSNAGADTITALSDTTPLYIVALIMNVSPGTTPYIAFMTPSQQAAPEI
jgi:hypothetical protein